MEAMFETMPLKLSPLLWFGVAILAGSLFGAALGLWLPPATPLLAG